MSFFVLELNRLWNIVCLVFCVFYSNSESLWADPIFMSALFLSYCEKDSVIQRVGASLPWGVCRLILCEPEWSGRHKSVQWKLQWVRPSTGGGSVKYEPSGQVPDQRFLTHCMQKRLVELSTCYHKRRSKIVGATYVLYVNVCLLIA